MKFVFIFLLSVGVALCAPDRKMPSNVTELFGSEENLEVVRQSDKVDACVLRHVPPPKGKKAGDERYEETAFVEISKEWVAAIQKVILEDSTHKWGSLAICWPRYNTRLRFHRGDRVVAIDICFSCDLLAIRRDGKVISGSVFDDRGRILLTGMQRLFPDDVALSKIR